MSWATAGWGNAEGWAVTAKPVVGALMGLTWKKKCKTDYLKKLVSLFTKGKHFISFMTQYGLGIVLC